MTDMGETCSYVAAAIFGVKAAVRIGLTNLSCASSAIEWLPCREDFAQRGKKKRPLVASPKKKFSTLAKSDRKPLSLIDFVSALEEIVPNIMLFTAVPKPKIDFVREIITDWTGETDVEVTCIESLKNSQKLKWSFWKI